MVPLKLNKGRKSISGGKKMRKAVLIAIFFLFFISAINFLYAQAQPAPYAQTQPSPRGGGSISEVMILVIIIGIGLIIFLFSKKLKKKHVDVVERKKKELTEQNYKKGGLEMEKRFPALQTAAAIFKALAWLVGIATVVTAIIVVIATSDGRGVFGLGGSFLARLLGILLVLIIGGFYALILYASAEWFLLMIAIEENTRISAGIYPREEIQGEEPRGKTEKTEEEIEK